MNVVIFDLLMQGSSLNDGVFCIVPDTLYFRQLYMPSSNFLSVFTWVIGYAMHMSG